MKPGQLRIPTKAIKELASLLAEHSDELVKFECRLDSGSTLVATRVRGDRSPDEVKRGFSQTYDAWDFEYNPGD